jgi:hypothetical protein
MISGVPEHVDGRMLGIAEMAGARLVNGGRMWHYTEGLKNWNPIWHIAGRMPLLRTPSRPRHSCGHLNRPPESAT